MRTGHPYGYKPCKTPLGAHVEAMGARLVILPVVLSPLIILGSGNAAGILAMPLLLLAPFLFMPRKKSQDEYKKEAADKLKRQYRHLMELSPADLARELCKPDQPTPSSRG